MDKLDVIEQNLFADLKRIRRVVVQSRVVAGPVTGEALVDRDTNLAVVDRLARRRAILRGIDAPSRREVEVITEDMLEDEIARLDAKAAEMDALMPESPE